MHNNIKNNIDNDDDDDDDVHLHVQNFQFWEAKERTKTMINGKM